MSASGSMRGSGSLVVRRVVTPSLWQVGMEIDFPELKQQRKIKSMQMFKKPVRRGPLLTSAAAGRCWRSAAGAPRLLNRC